LVPLASIHRGGFPVAVFFMRFLRMSVGNLGILPQYIHYKSILNDIIRLCNCQEDFYKKSKETCCAVLFAAV